MELDFSIEGTDLGWCSFEDGGRSATCFNQVTTGQIGRRIASRELRLIGHISEVRDYRHYHNIDVRDLKLKSIFVVLNCRFNESAPYHQPCKYLKLHKYIVFEIRLLDPFD